jgi:hypothetical protein
VLSMESVSWIIFEDGCVGHKFMDMMDTIYCIEKSKKPALP